MKNRRESDPRWGRKLWHLLHIIVAAGLLMYVMVKPNAAPQETLNRKSVAIVPDAGGTATPTVAAPYCRTLTSLYPDEEAAILYWCHRTVYVH